MRHFMRSTKVGDNKFKWEEIQHQDIKRGDRLKIVTINEEEEKVEIMYFEALSGYNKKLGEIKKLKPLISKPIIGKYERPN